MKIKICGLTRLEDALLALEAGADYLGFIFAESPRRLDPPAARRIISALPREAATVGVFVNADPREVEEAIRSSGIKMLQFHGQEPPEYCRSFDLPVIKALRLRGEEVLDLIPRYDRRANTVALLLEPYVPGRHGGTGKQADWELARRAVTSFPFRRFMLAGGLGPENIRAALARVNPWAVDVASGVEVRPGIKDPGKLKQMIEVVKRYEATG